VERRHIVHELQAKLDAATLEELRSLALTPATQTAKVADNVKELLRSFVDAQRQRMERRKKLESLRAGGQDVRAASREDLSPGRFVEITYNVATFEKVCGDDRWDGTEAPAARVVSKFRAAAEKSMLAGEVKPRTFNKWITLARQFCGWAESTYRLDRLPKDKSLFAKYDVGDSQAKAIPAETLKKLWRAADDRGRCFIMLALNCGFYAVDISDLKAEQIGETHLSHVRGKSGVRVRYLLWPETRELLKRAAAKTGRAFTTREGTPLVHYSKLAKSGEPARVDNVRNWWVRLCVAADVKGYRFSNLRDTASTALESIDQTMTDLFLAHSDPRMATFCVDGEMVETEPLDRVIGELERKNSSLWKCK
jgi:integrase